MSVRHLVKKARKLWNDPEVPPHINRHNRKAWIRAVLRLGDRWLLAAPIQRPTQ